MTLVNFLQTPEKVTAHSISVEGTKEVRTAFLIKLKPYVIERERKLG